MVDPRHVGICLRSFMLLPPPPPQTGLYHDQRNYSSLTKTKATPPTSTSTYRPRVGRQHFDICMVWRVGHKRRGGSLSTFWFMQFYTHIYLYIYKYRYSHRRDSLVQYYTVLLDLYYWTVTTGPLLLDPHYWTFTSHSLSELNSA